MATLGKKMIGFCKGERAVGKNSVFFSIKIAIDEACLVYMYSFVYQLTTPWDRSVIASGSHTNVKAFANL